MSMSYEIITKQELLEALKKALKKNSKELPPKELSYDEYVSQIYEELQAHKIKLDPVIKYQLTFGSKILNIDRCSLKNRVIEYALAEKIKKANEQYWYSMRKNIFRTGSGINEFVRNARKKHENYEYVYLIDLRHAFGIDYKKLREEYLLKILNEEQVGLIDLALFSDNKISEGLPFGHKLSNILFDCYLIEIEKYFAHNGYVFLRLIDSFAFFTNDRKDCLQINEVFEKFGLHVNDKKSKFLDKEDFVDFDKEILI